MIEKIGPTQVWTKLEKQWAYPEGVGETKFRVTASTHNWSLSFSSNLVLSTMHDPEMISAFLNIVATAEAWLNEQARLQSFEAPDDFTEEDA
jgi:hypothetical protein